MGRIVPGIRSLKQHKQTFDKDSEQYSPSSCEQYRPPCCPHCGRRGLWGHGSYPRQADREHSSRESLNPVFIPRFICPSCGRTCSRLPECVAPRRWYGWALQEAVILLLLAGSSIRAASHAFLPSRRTVARWWQWLQDSFELFSFHLRSREPALGRFPELRSFWTAALQEQPLSAWMVALDQMEVVVP